MVAVLCVAASACSSGPEEASGEATLPVTDLPTTCEGFGNLPDSGQVTFVKGDLVFGVSPDGVGLHCITGVAGINPIAWSPQGDFVLDIGFTASEVISDAGRVTISGPGKSPRFLGISPSLGTYALFGARDGTRLAKLPVDGGPPVDISFLRRHDEAVYHPSGTQLAVLGETEKQAIYGMWLVTNEGKEPHLIVPTRDEDEFYGMQFSALGATLYYVDDQHDHFELRVVDLSTLKEGIALPKSELVVDEREPISNLTSPFTAGVLAYRVGSCGSGLETFVKEGSSTTKVGADLADTQPVGWLPDDRLVLAAADDLCDPNRTLDLYVVDGDDAELVVEDVAWAAVRAVLPEPQPPVSGPVGAEAD
jgi:hypothetical protein